MALFKPFYGSEEELNQVLYHEGYAYFTVADTKCLFVDVNGKRHKINAEFAEKLRYLGADGNYIEIDVEDLLLSSDIIPIASGGTGASDAAGARANLEVYSKTEVDNKVSNVSTTSYTATLLSSGWVNNNGVYEYTYTNSNLKCGEDGTVPPIISFLSNQEEYSKISSAEATAGTGIVFQCTEAPTSNIGIVIIDVR